MRDRKAELEGAMERLVTVMHLKGITDDEVLIGREDPIYEYLFSELAKPAPRDGMAVRAHLAKMLTNYLPKADEEKRLLLADYFIGCALLTKMATTPYTFADEGEGLLTGTA